MTPRFTLSRMHDHKAFQIARPSTLVGRGSSCDIHLLQGAPSREHARLVLRKEGLFVEDLHSTNGTKVNGKRLTESVQLHHGDVVDFSSETFLVEDALAEDATMLTSNLSMGNTNPDSAVMEEEEDDPDATQVRQDFPLPPGWSPLDRERLAEFQTEETQPDRQEVLAVIRKSLTDSDELYTAAVMVLDNDKNPIVTGLCSDSGKTVWKLGRGESVDIRLSDPSVSDHHAELLCEGAKWLVKDLGSTNGLRYRGRKTTTAELAEFDYFKLGRVSVVFCTLDLL